MKSSLIIRIYTYLAISPLCLPIQAIGAGNSLSDCYQSALKRSEIVASQSQQIEQAEDHYRQAIGSLLPTISATASYLKQDSPPVASPMFPSSQPLVKLSLSQPLFRGFREFAALRQTGYFSDAEHAAKDQAELQIFYDVSQNFYTVLSLEKDVENLIGEIDLYGKRISELNARIKIGRSRLAEVLAVQTSLSSLQAEKERVKGQLAATREMFAFLTGMKSDTLLLDQSTLPTSLSPLSDYLLKIDRRPEVRQANYRDNAAREAITIAKGGHWPAADLMGNYYFKRSGLQDQVRWDVQAVLTLPIFNGGIIQSQIAEAKSKQMQSELTVTRSKRNAEQEIKTLYRNVEANIAQVMEIKRTVSLAERSYEQQQKEYRLGLVNNLDVLNALVSFHQSQRSLDQSKYQSAINYEKLLAASGKSGQLGVRDGEKNQQD